MNANDVAKKLKTSLRLGIAQGAASSSVLTISNNLLIPFGIALKSTSFQIGLLGAVPNLMSAFAQLLAPALVKQMGNRKRVAQLSALLGALAWCLIFSIPFVFHFGSVWWLLGFAVLAVVALNLPNSAWGSWIADLVTANRRGTYLGFNTSIASLVSAVVFLSLGMVLDLSRNEVDIGFAVVFAIASAGSLVSLALFSRTYEPPMRTRMATPALGKFFKEMYKSNLRYFFMYSFGTYFGAYLSSAFFAVYQLQTLHLSYLTYVGLSVVSSISTVLAATFWGPFADRRGNVQVLRMTAFILPFVPILWLVSRFLPFLFFIQILAGVVWGAITLCSLNFVMGASSEDIRTTNLSYFYALNGIAMFLGGVIGGLIVPHLPNISGSNLLTLFLISGIVRMCIAIVLIPRLKEVREVEGEAL